jgi:hypothetical protein
MRKLLTLLFLLGISTGLRSQVPDQPATSTTEQQLENITENNEDFENEDDSYLQEMVQFLKNPVNLNESTPEILKELVILSPLQIQNFLSYRQLFGKLINIYELQAVPAWDVRTIQKILPYISVSTEVNIVDAFKNRFSGGQHTVLARVSQTVEKSKGFLLDSSNAKNFYPGSPQRLLFRYKYTYKNLLQYGFVAEKDAGEEFFKGSQKQGFDYYSAHLFARNLGIIKALAIGDFTVNMGQGLVQWQSLAFKKGPDVVATKRQSAVLRPYNSFGEINFHRGLGITIGKKNWEATVFGSYKKLDANFVTDTLSNTDDFISSLQTSGLHRTKSEVEDKGSQTQVAFGGNIALQLNKLHLGLNAIQYNLKFPVVKAPDPYNLFALSGKSFGNYSIDYSYTYKNLHFFGEAASSSQQKLAFVNGLLISVSNTTDLSLFYRNISRAYQSLYTNAFTENTYPTNEKGLFTGITMRPTSQWQVDAYMDMYKFPWLKYRVNAPTTGSDYFVQVTYRPSRQLEIYSRFKREAKPINYNPDGLVLNPLVYQPRQNWRTQINYIISRQITVRNRAEIVWYDKKGTAAEQGFLLLTDVFYKPQLKPYSANMRLLFFETGGYNSRLYAYENDVLYSFSIPVIYDKGFRYYLNLNYDLTKKLTLWGRWAQTIYRDKNTIGSGLDLIQGNKRSEYKIQAVYKF